MRTKRRNKTSLLSRAPIAGRLHLVRKHFGFSQDQMAQSLGCSRETYGKNERGYYMLTIDTVAAFYEKLGVSMEWLLFNHGPMLRDNGIKKSELKLETQADMSFPDELNEMIGMMKNVPFLRYAVMGYYQKFKLENKHTILQALGQDKTTGNE